jgi:hypothetical protein
MKRQKVRGERREPRRGAQVGRAGQWESRREGQAGKQADDPPVDVAPEGAEAPGPGLLQGGETPAINEAVPEAEPEAAPEIHRGPAPEAQQERAEPRQEPAIAPPRLWLEEGLVTVAQARAIEGMLEPGEPGPGTLGRLVEAGVITRSQAGAVQRMQLGNGHALVPVTGRQSAAVGPEPDGRPAGVRVPRLSLDARKLGVFLAGIASLGVLWAVISILAGVIGAPRRSLGVDLAEALGVLGSALVLVGGRRMYRRVQNGKPMALIGLVIYLLASLLLLARRLGDPVVLGLLVAWAVLYYLTTLSRFRPLQKPDTAPGPR